MGKLPDISSSSSNIKATSLSMATSNQFTPLSSNIKIPTHPNLKSIQKEIPTTPTKSDSDHISMSTSDSISNNRLGNNIHNTPSKSFLSRISNAIHSTTSSPTSNDLSSISKSPLLNNNNRSAEVFLDSPLSTPNKNSQKSEESRTDPVSKVELNMGQILNFFEISKKNLQEMYLCKDIEVIFNKKRQIISTDEMILYCNSEMDKYISILEEAKTKAIHSEQHSHLAHTKSSSFSKKFSKSSQATEAVTSNLRLAKIADQIFMAIHDMRDLYILSQNLLKRVSLASEWNELHNVVIYDLETEINSLYKELQLVQNSIKHNILLFPADTVLKVSAYNSSELNFLSQAILQGSSNGGSRTIPYLNEEQQVETSR